MKRRADSLEVTEPPGSTTDEHKTILSDLSLQKPIEDLESLQDPVGWIGGAVFMIWANRKQPKIQLKSGNYRVDVAFGGENTHLLDFDQHDTVRISLKGSQFHHKNTSHQQYLPFNIVYEEGVALLFVSRSKKPAGNGKIVTTFPSVLPLDALAENDWFFSPPRPAELEPVENGEDLNSMEVDLSADDSRQTTKTSQLPKNLDHDPMDQDTTPTHDNPVHSLPTPTPTASRGTSPASAGFEQNNAERPRKKLKKKDTRHANSVRGDKADGRKRETPSEEPAQSTSKKPITAAERRKAKNDRKKLRLASKADRMESVPPPPPARNPALDLQAGFNCESGRYTAMKDLDKLTYGRVNLIGVMAAHTSPPQQRGGKDKFVSLTIIDPSNFENHSGFKVNCFTKEHDAWLPAPEKGHIVLLRDVKVSSWNGGVNGICYPDKLKWVAYDPTNGRTYHNPLNGVPRHIISDRGFGPEYSPFWEPDAKELEYCLQLGEWWRAVEEERTAGAITVEYRGSSATREHRLIGDMSSGVFFDATIEVLRVTTRDNGNIDLVITDYTANPLISRRGLLGQYGLWCSTSRITDSVDRQNLTVGSYWRFRNIRIKSRAQGDTEGDLYDVKLTGLDEADEDDTRLQALLTRKKDFQSRELPPSSPSAVTLISDAKAYSYHTFAVEVLYHQDDGNATDLFVTDYTKNPFASRNIPDKLFRAAKGVPVFRFAVWDDREWIKTLKLGDYYEIRDVKIVEDANCLLKGNLNHPRENVVKYSKTSSENENFHALLKRKEEWRKQEGASVLAANGGGKSTERSVVSNPPLLVNSLHTDQPRHSIKQILETIKQPNKFRFNARIVDYWPRRIADFTKHMCRKCNELIPETQHACIACDDTMAEYVEWYYHFLFRLEDESGTQFEVALDGEEATYFLCNLKPVDLTRDHDSLQKLTEMLRPILGNLIEAHEDLGEVKPEYGPYLDLAIKSWPFDNGKIAYCMTGCWM